MDETSRAGEDFFSLSSRGARATGCPSLGAARLLCCSVCLGLPCSSRTHCIYSGAAIDSSATVKPEDKKEAPIAAPATHISFESKAPKADDKEEIPQKDVFLERKVAVSLLNDDNESSCFGGVSDADILNVMSEIEELENKMA